MTVDNTFVAVRCFKETRTVIYVCSNTYYADVFDQNNNKKYKNYADVFSESTELQHYSTEQMSALVMTVCNTTASYIVFPSQTRHEPSPPILIKSHAQLPHHEKFDFPTQKQLASTA